MISSVRFGNLTLSKGYFVTICVHHIAMSCSEQTLTECVCCGRLHDVVHEAQVISCTQESAFAFPYLLLICGLTLYCSAVHRVFLLVQWRKSLTDRHGTNPHLEYHGRLFGI